MATFAHKDQTLRGRSPRRRPTRGVSAAFGGVGAVIVNVALSSATPALGAETVSPLPILFWVAAPLLVAGASTVLAYAVGLLVRQVRRLLNPGRAALHRRSANLDAPAAPESPLSGLR
jgi:hypothetical protein